MKKYILGGLVAVVVLSIAIFIARPEQTTASMGFVDYTYKVLNFSNASSTDTVSYAIRGGKGVLGNIVVASSSATKLKIYDAVTSTSSGTLIGEIKAGVTEQTFVFDVAVTKGIMVDVLSGFNGVYTFTTR